MFLEIDYMITFIRFFCVSFLFCWGALLAEPLYLPFDSAQTYQYQTHTHATWTIEVDRKPLEISSQFDLKGEAKFSLEDQQINMMQFRLKEASLAFGDQKLSLEQPQHSIEMNELKIFQNQWMPFDFLMTPPYVQLNKKAEELYKDLKLVKEPILIGIFGEDFHLLTELLKRPLVIGEGFEVIVPRREQRQYEMVQTVVVKEINQDSLIVEVTTVSDRQKINLEEGDAAVLYYQAEAVWVLDKRNGLNFQIVENGIFTQSMRSQGVDSNQKQMIRRDVKLVGAGQPESN